MMIATVTAQLGISAAFQGPPDELAAAETERGKNENTNNRDKKIL